MNRSLVRVPLLLSAAFLSATALADNEWDFGASINGWLPDISVRTHFPSGSGGDFTVGIGDILDHVEFVFQGSFDARKGNWGFFTDVIYMDLGASKQALRGGTIGGTPIPTDVTASIGADLKSLIWTATGYRRMADREHGTFDVLAGFRYSDIKQRLDWSSEGDLGQLPLPGLDGRSTVSADYWDFIVGLRGRGVFGPNNTWFIPYYADIGTGDSDFTVQAFGGIGYAFRWGEVVGGWRYLEYDLPSGDLIRKMDFSGPIFGVAFRW